MRYLVILDDGHGIDTSGKRTPLFEDGTFMKENEFSSVVVEYVYDLFKPYDNVDIFYSASEKIDISLDERVQRINDVYEDGKNKYGKIVLVSVHANALTGEWGTQNGTATFHYPTNMTDKAFAEVIQKNLIAKTKLKPHRGGVVADNFQIIRDVKCTACLVECAFMDNLVEAKLMLTDEFRKDCAEGITNGLLEYFNIKSNDIIVTPPTVPTVPVVPTIPIVKGKVLYSVTPNGTYELKGNVVDFGIKIVNQKNRTIEEPNCTNCGFFWNTDKANIKYATSILYADGITYQSLANHLPSPQSVFIVYKDNTVAMKRIHNLGELNLSKVRLVIGGVGLRDTTNSTFTYSPIAEGFSGAYADVLRKTNKTVLGYNVKEDKIYLMVRKNIAHNSPTEFDLLELVEQCGYDIALSLDGGGSTFMNNETDMVVYGDNRIVHSIAGFNLLS